MMHHLVVFQAEIPFRDPLPCLEVRIVIYTHFPTPFATPTTVAWFPLRKTRAARLMGLKPSLRPL